MGNLPVLKPREVVKILENLGFTEVRQRGWHKQFRPQTADLRPFRFIKAEMFRRFFCEKLLKT